MTYQVSDTDLNARDIRTTALGQACCRSCSARSSSPVTINLVAGLAELQQVSRMAR